MKSVLLVVVMTSLMMLSACRSVVVAEAPAHCRTKDEWAGYIAVAQSKVSIFRPDDEGYPTQHHRFADRVDYLESVCLGINAYRGDDV